MRTKYIRDDYVFPPGVLERLRELLPTLSIHDAHYYSEVGEIWLRVKADCAGEKGKYGRAVKAAGYHIANVRNYIFIFKSGFRGEQLDHSINEVLAAIRKGRKQDYNEQLAQIQDWHSNEFIPEADSIVEADSLEWFKDVETGSVANFISDPPYGIGFIYAKGTEHEWKEADNAKDHIAWFKPFWEEMVRCVVPGGTIVIWQHYGYRSYFEKWFPGSHLDVMPIRYMSYQTWNPLIRWTKPGRGAIHKAMMCPKLPICLEPVRGHHDSPELYGVHPCPKHFGETLAVVKHYTRGTALVCDPFCGTGSVPAAAKQLGRKYVGIERNPAYVKIARRRVAETQAE